MGINDSIELEHITFLEFKAFVLWLLGVILLNKVTPLSSMTIK